MNRHIVITGATGSLGKSITFKFDNSSNLIGLHYFSNKKGAKSLKSQLSANSYLIQSDFSKKNTAEHFVKQISAENKPVDVLILNAAYVKDALLLKTTEAEWDKIININYATQVKIINKIINNGLLNNNAHIIIISSHSGIHGRSGLSAYAASKAAIIGFTYDAAKKLANKNIMVNAILPGWLLSNMTKHISPQKMKKNISKNLLGRGNKPDEIAEFIFNLSLTKNISGQVFALDSRPIFPNFAIPDSTTK